MQFNLQTHKNLIVQIILQNFSTKMTWVFVTVALKCYVKSMKEKWKREESEEEKNQTSRTCIDLATFERANLLAHSREQISFVQITTMIQAIFHQPTYDYLYK